MSQLHQIAKLQSLDSDIRSKKLRLAEILQAQKERGELDAAREAVAQLSAELETQQKQQRQLNQEVAGISAKIKSAETRLYSGEVKSPKELGDLQQSVAAQKRQRETVEESLLETMLEVEDVGEKLNSAEATLADVEARWTSDQASLKVEGRQLALALNEQLANRKVQAAKIDGSTLTKYDNLRRTRAGVGAVAVQNELCGGCQVVVPSTKLKDVSRGKVVFCGNCGRILL